MKRTLDMVDVMAYDAALKSSPPVDLVVTRTPILEYQPTHDVSVDIHEEDL